MRWSRRFWWSRSTQRCWRDWDVRGDDWEATGYWPKDSRGLVDLLDHYSNDLRLRLTRLAASRWGSATGQVLSVSKVRISFFSIILNLKSEYFEWLRVRVNFSHYLRHKILSGRVRVHKFYLRFLILLKGLKKYELKKKPEVKILPRSKVMAVFVFSWWLHLCQTSGKRLIFPIFSI